MCIFTYMCIYIYIFIYVYIRIYPMFGYVGVAQPQTGLNQFKAVVGLRWERKGAGKAAACYGWATQGMVKTRNPTATTITYKVFREFHVFFAEPNHTPFLLHCWFANPVFKHCFYFVLLIVDLVSTMFLLCLFQSSGWCIQDPSPAYPLSWNHRGAIRLSHFTLASETSLFCWWESV